MSYTIYFWREEKEIGLSPEKVSETLSNDKHIPGIFCFPKEDIVIAFKNEFPDIVDNDIELEWEGAGSYFQVGFTHGLENKVNSITVDCGYSLLKSPDTMNRIIDVGARLGCALYDPQVGKRFNQPSI